MPGGKGIIVQNPLKDPTDFEARIPKEVDVKDKLSHVIQAVVRIKEVSALNHDCCSLEGDINTTFSRRSTPPITTVGV